MKIKILSRIILPAAFLVLICLDLMPCEKLTTVSSFKSNYIMKDLAQKPKVPSKVAKPKEAPAKTPTKKSKDPQPIPPPDATTPPADPSQSDIHFIEELPDTPILYKGWVKYFHYKDDAQVKPKTFFKNELFEKQVTKKTGSDEHGSFSIPSEKSFFAVVYQDNVNFLTSRDDEKENSIPAVWDTLQIDFIKSIPENNVHSGGVKDLGVFSEGSCFRVTTFVPPKSTFFKMSPEIPEPRGLGKENWMLCTEKNSDKLKLMVIIMKLKLKKQHNNGVFIIGKEAKKHENRSMIPDDLLEGKFINDPERSPDDGYWVLLQDWTKCTLKCGGGKQVRQLMCIPPKKGGKPCVGKEIRERPCNTQPCPDVRSMEKLMAKETKPPSDILQKVEKPIVSVMSISKRPKRYDKCYMKDSDALMVKDDKDNAGMSIRPKIPVRLVMNNKSVVVYQDDSLTSVYKTFLLEQTQLLVIPDKKHCFVLQSRNDQAEFCMLDSDDSGFVREWEYDFNLFKNDCRQERKTVSKEEQEEYNRFQQRLEKLKQEFVQKKINTVKQASEKSEEMNMQKKIQQTQVLSLNAIQNEVKIEELLKIDEEQREKELMEKLMAMLEEEKKKKECLINTLNEKSLEMQYYISKNKENKEIDKIKEEAKQQILAKRAAIKEKIQFLRKKSERRLEVVKNEILKLRSETAGSLQKMSKEGKMSNCFNPEHLQPDQAEEKIEKYCVKNFSDNFAKFTDCKTKENFCYACCENEFGRVHMAERENCYSSICEKIVMEVRPKNEVKTEISKNTC